MLKQQFQGKMDMPGIPAIDVRQQCAGFLYGISIADNFIKNGINMLYPTYDDISSIQSGIDNPKGLRMVEFPIVNAFTAGIILLGNLQQQEVLVGRLVSVFFSIMALLGIYYVGKELSGKKVGFILRFSKRICIGFDIY